jgi:hypothetical protein
MKTSKIVLIILFFVSIHTFAQPPMGDKKDQIKSLKVGYITNELALTTEEASKFWPIYNDFDDKQFELKNQKMKAFKARMDDDSLNKMSERSLIPTRPNGKYRG